MTTQYQPGDQIEWLTTEGEWLSLGRYVATTSDGTVVCEGSNGAPTWHRAVPTRRAPDMITVTVEISREAAAEIAEYGNPAVAGRGSARHAGYQAFHDAVTEAVES